MKKSISEQIQEWEKWKKPGETPSLYRKLKNGNWQIVAGLTPFSVQVRSEKHEDARLNHFVEVKYIKCPGDVVYEVLENKSEIIVRYYWKDYDPTEDDQEDFEPYALDIE